MFVLLVQASSGSGGGDGFGDGRGIGGGFGRPYPTVGPGDGNGMGGGFGRGGGSGRPDPSVGSGGGDGFGDGDEKYSDLGDERKLLLDNLSENINEDNLKEHFGKYGEIEDVFVSIDPFTQKCGGFGSITFRSKAIVETVMASSPHLLDGSKIVVSRDQEDRNVTGPDGGNVVEDRYAPHRRPRDRGRGGGSRGGGRGDHRGRRRGRGRDYREATQ
ncbi:RNA-binding protein 3-like [Branchiostoma floridae]|uniref:RNA-binding protein 3-like n=2 Tax=Branchiostoma floridae TaxID=7739 RepID=A0A9J7HSD7_BRAFL|nr:RNA-binding protein 3-like [Branchiostoma floridae]